MTSGNGRHCRGCGSGGRFRSVLPVGWSDYSTSTTLAPAAAFWTDSQPFLAADFVSYASPLATT